MKQFSNKIIKKEEEKNTLKIRAHPENRPGASGFEG